MKRATLIIVLCVLWRSVKMQPNQESVLEVGKVLSIDETWSWLVSGLVSAFPNVTAVCRRDFQALFSNIWNDEQGKGIKRWSLQMLDSMGKPPAAFTRWDMFWLGNFQQCLDVHVPEQDLMGEYCIVNLYFNANDTTQNEDIAAASIVDYSSVKWGVCFPSTCHLQDKRKLMNFYADAVGFKAVVHPATCQTGIPTLMDSTAKLITLLMLIPVACVLVATALDAWDPLNGSPNLFRHVFSAYRSLRSLFFRKVHASGQSFDFLHGSRLILALLVVWTHTQMFLSLDVPIKSHAIVYNMLIERLLNLRNHTSWVLNTFFFLSGFCLAYFTVLKRESFSVGTVVKFYGVRYLRFTVPYLYVMAFISGPLLYTFKGPLWPSMETLQLGCRNNWWRNILYTNYLGPNIEDDKCIVGEWYLNIDWHLYLMTVPLVLLLNSVGRAKRLISYVFVFFAMSSMAAFALMVALRKDNILLTVHQTTEMSTDYDSRRCWYRLSNSLLGALFGYYMSKYPDKIKMNSFTTFCGFTSTMAIIVTCITVMGTKTSGQELMSLPWQIVYTSLGNLVCNVATVWLILHCFFTPKSWINLILSQTYLVALGKLSFSIFLVHFTLLHIRFERLSEPLLYSDGILTLEYVRVSALSICVAVILYVVVESPWERLQHLIFTPSTQKTLPNKNLPCQSA